MSGDTWASDEVVQECVTRALAATLTPQTKIHLSQRGLQFVEEYSNSIKRLDFNEHQCFLQIPQIACSHNLEVHFIFSVKCN